MLVSRTSSALLVASTLSLGSLGPLGCASGAPPGDPEETGAAGQAIMWSNGDLPGDFWATSTQLALQQLARGALVDPTGALAPTPLALTSGGRAVLGYVVGCALPPGTTVTSAAGSFAGWAGVAPAWASGPLDTSSQRWMTACLLQTLNGLGVHVPLRLTGSNPGLADLPGTGAASFTVPDATAFGNVFVAGGPAYICTNLGNADACAIEASSYALERVCGASPLCGVTLLGPCALSCAAGPTCTAPGGAAYPEAISTWLDPTVAVSLLPLCSLL
jgi:hypothetical protein